MLFFNACERPPEFRARRADEALLAKHPDVAKQMEQMHSEDPKKWATQMKPKWDAAPES